ncbi:MAG: hypothetical protein AB7P69_15815 [Candidatus Binatia bacterium]
MNDGRINRGVMLGGLSGLVTPHSHSTNLKAITGQQQNQVSLRAADRTHDRVVPQHSWH